MVRHGCFSTSSTHLPSSLASTVLQFHIEAELMSFSVRSLCSFCYFPRPRPFLSQQASRISRMHSSRCVRLGSDLTDSAKTVIITPHRERVLALGEAGCRKHKQTRCTARWGEKERGENTSARKREEKSGGAARALSGKRRADRTDGHPPATGIHTISHSPSQRESLLSCATTTDCKKIRAERTETGLAMLL